MKPGGVLTNLQKMKMFLHYLGDPGFQVGVAEDECGPTPYIKNIYVRTQGNYITEHHRAGWLLQILFWEHSVVASPFSNGFNRYLYSCFSIIISWAITDVFCHCCCTENFYFAFVSHQRVCFIIFQYIKVFTVAFFYWCGRCKKFVPIPNPYSLLLVKYTLC